MKRADADAWVQRARESQEYRDALRRQASERRRDGRKLLDERFRIACQAMAGRAHVTLDGVHAELARTVLDLSLKHVHKLATAAGLTVDWDGVIVRNAAFEAFIR